MSFQVTEDIVLGEIKISKNKNIVLAIPNIGTSMALVVYDLRNRIGGIAHIVLPESDVGVRKPNESIGKYADIAVPELIRQFTEEGGELREITIRLVGGAQLFNFGGGGGNFLNIGSRNAVAIRTALSKMNLTIDKADIGGNKGKSLRFVIATGQLFIKQIGSGEYIL